MSASSDERRAQEIAGQELRDTGLETELLPFRFNRSLYANLALTFGLGVLGTVVAGYSPVVGLALHLLAAISFAADSSRRGYLLRRVFRFWPSQNLLATLPAAGEPKLRVVLGAHADAAYTGLLFHPRVIRAATNGRVPLWMRRSLLLGTISLLALAGLDLVSLFGHFGPLLHMLRWALTIPALVTFLFNLELVVRNRVVPGANDNLSGVAALPILARRMAVKKPADVELVFAVTGCEEASLGGADALARALRKKWDRGRTVFIALDGLTNGTLRYLEEEGDVLSNSVPGWLVETMQEVAASEPRFANVQPFRSPVGGSDAGAFLAHGWDAGALVCVEEGLGSPRHYHSPQDTPENLDLDQLMESIDFTEKLVEAIIQRRAASG
jgi:hypothetical protein